MDLLKINGQNSNENKNVPNNNLQQNNTTPKYIDLSKEK